MTKQETLKALKCCTNGYCADECERFECPLFFSASTEECNDLNLYAAELIESLMVELEQAKQERDEWKLRAEAAERDMVKSPYCPTCAYYKTPECEKKREIRDQLRYTVPCYQWRGVHKKNGGVG